MVVETLLIGDTGAGKSVHHPPLAGMVVETLAPYWAKSTAFIHHPPLAGMVVETFALGKGRGKNQTITPP